MKQQTKWQPDVLGAGFEQLTLPLEPDAEGEVVATLVRYAPGPRLSDVHFERDPAAHTDVLYVHGWSDYFFQKELAEYWHRMGARFYALDLRKYGRSLRRWQTPGYVENLTTYDEEIEAALAVIGQTGGRRLVLFGHSTGGLTLSLWVNRHPGRADALVLNSPWLEFQARSAGRAALAPIVGLQARVDPRAAMPNVDLGFYTRTVSATMDGEWDYDLDWRPPRGFVVHSGWLSAVLAGHAQVAAGLAIDAPVLTMASARSTISPRWTPEMMSSDIVLVVDDIARRALSLAPTVTVTRIDGALHDIFLSKEPVRKEAYGRMTRWLRGYLST
ncbi:alpha/beta hydrolase [Leifsonia poae]|uniref:alpha/beta hydrolase n=1 Tax=Leifsonia poae TaxID=110933 RepID=UPI001CBC6CE8|nr:alpha/beta hydrolase [Leifsonia poae]